MLAIEICWNVYPPNQNNSFILLICHLIILKALWDAPISNVEIKENDEKKKNSTTTTTTKKTK
jgi:hypothetical protein